MGCRLPGKYALCYCSLWGVYSIATHTISNEEDRDRLAIARYGWKIQSL
jgi:hypothetical protein